MLKTLWIPTKTKGRVFVHLVLIGGIVNGCATFGGSKSSTSAGSKPTREPQSPAASGARSAGAQTNQVISAEQHSGKNDPVAIRLAPGDRVSLRIAQDRTDAKLLIVSDSGELDIPHLGRIEAKGKSCAELSQIIKEGLDKKFYHGATVELGVDQLNRTRGTIYISGEVRGPGPQVLPSDETLTLARAIIRAGGFSDFADQRRVRITREKIAEGEKRVITVDVGRVLRRGEVEKDLRLEAGDLIYVPEKLLNF